MKAKDKVLEAHPLARARRHKGKDYFTRSTFWMWRIEINPYNLLSDWCRTKEMAWRNAADRLK